MRKPHRGGISIHAPPRGATSWLREIDSRGAISIHAPPRGATRKTSKHRKNNLFQFTPLREGRHQNRRNGLYAADYFNSRPSARGDGRGACVGKGACISIHAPPRGATMTGKHADLIVCISIHAPPRGATSRSYSGACALRFQFTPLREGRLPAVQRRGRMENFNSRPSARGDRGALRLRMQPNDFNSRPSARGDVHGVCWGYWNLISIHAPPRGATRCSALSEAGLHFNSRPSARGDQRRCNVASGICDFNSRPSARGDSDFLTPPPPHPYFNSRPSARGD